MDGIFVRKKLSIGIIFLLCGICSIAMFLFLNNVDDQTSAWKLCFFLIFGIFCCLVSIPSFLFNRGAYFCITETRIRARYHWFGRLDCPMEEVAFVLPQINTLTLLLKNGKRHVITGIENAQGLSNAIRKLCFTPEQETPEALRQKLAEAQAARQRSLWWVVGGCALLFANIFIAVSLTGGRDFDVFSKLDWILFSVMGVVELLTLIALFWAAQRCGKQLLPIDQLRFRLRGAIITTAQLPSNIVTGLYTDADQYGRIVVCGFPNDNGMYYCVQEFTGDYELKTVRTSDIYDSADDLIEDPFCDLIDISSLL